VTVVYAGYMTQVLGIQSHCRLRDLHHLRPAEMSGCMANVIPALPLLEVSTSLPKSRGFCSMDDSECVVSSAALTVYAGQRYVLVRGMLYHLLLFVSFCSSVTCIDVLLYQTPAFCCRCKKYSCASASA